MRWLVNSRYFLPAVVVGALACLFPPVHAQTEYWVQTYVRPENERTLREFLVHRISGIEGLRLNSVVASPVGMHFDYYVTYRGKIVYGTSVKAHVNRDFILYAYHVFLWPPLERIDEQWTAPFPVVKQAVIAADSGFFLHDNRLIAAYRVQTYDYDGGHELFFDAADGQLMVRRPRAVRQNPRGYVFFPDPVTAAQTVYDCQTDFCDNDDRTNPTLDALRVEVELEGLSIDTGRYVLRGPHVVIVDVAPPVRPVPRSDDGLFLFDRSHPDFEAVNVYFHIHRYARYLASLGYEGICPMPVKADARGTAGDNSFFTEDATGGLIQFGVGGVDDGEDMDVVLHEYGHAISACVAPNSNEGFERRAADEGWGDYIAASASLDLSSYRWADLFTWDGHNEFWAGRSAQDQRTMNQVLAQSPNNIYALGALWASALMRARAQMPREQADRTVLQAQYFNARNMSLRSAAMAVLIADSLLHQQRYRRIFLESFCRSGVLSENDCLSLSRPNGLSRPNVYPVPVRNGFVVELSIPRARIFVHDAVGKAVYHNPDYQNQTFVKTDDWPTGMYVLSVMDSSGHGEQIKIPVLR